MEGGRKSPSSILSKVNEGWTSGGSEGQKHFLFVQVHSILRLWHFLNSLAIYQVMTKDSCLAIYQPRVYCIYLCASLCVNKLCMEGNKSSSTVGLQQNCQGTVSTTNTNKGSFSWHLWSSHYDQSWNHWKQKRVHLSSSYHSIPWMENPPSTLLHLHLMTCRTNLLCL